MVAIRSILQSQANDMVHLDAMATIIHTAATDTTPTARPTVMLTVILVARLKRTKQA